MPEQGFKHFPAYEVLEHNMPSFGYGRQSFAQQIEIARPVLFHADDFILTRTSGADEPKVFTFEERVIVANSVTCQLNVR